MSDYRRLISYIYEYEGKEKGKNVGFVKLEARNGQCRLNLSIKKVYVGGNAIGVYLLGKNGTETFLGNIFIRGGNGEFRATVDAADVEGSRNGLDTYYGLTVHDVKNSWRSYTTIWEDAVLPETNEVMTPVPAGVPAGDALRLLPAHEVLPGSGEVKAAPVVSSVVKEIEAEIAREEERKSQGIPAFAHAAEVGGNAASASNVALGGNAASASNVAAGGNAAADTNMASDTEISSEINLPAGNEIKEPSAEAGSRRLDVQSGENSGNGNSTPGISGEVMENVRYAPSGEETMHGFIAERAPGTVTGAAAASNAGGVSEIATGAATAPNAGGMPGTVTGAAIAPNAGGVPGAGNRAAAPVAGSIPGTAVGAAGTTGGMPDRAAAGTGGGMSDRAASGTGGRMPDRTVAGTTGGMPDRAASGTGGGMVNRISPGIGTRPNTGVNTGTAPTLNMTADMAAGTAGRSRMPNPSVGLMPGIGGAKAGAPMPSKENGGRQGAMVSAGTTQDEIIMRSPELENPDVLKYLQETEDVAADPEKLWQELRKMYPKIQAFDYENGCEILTIRPQDIGRLPRESWVYGNNSFLLHGYYNYRYIILFRLGSKDGRPRYLIGVPGHYYSSEKYMASMFGFPNFVLSKKQPPNDGRFGYWYTDIRIR